MTIARNCLLLLLAAVTAGAASITAQETKYKVPRTEAGQPDLRGVWNFSTNVPLERPTAFADKKLFTPEEIEKRKAAQQRALQSIASFAPVEDVGLAWLDNTVHVEDLRTSLITYPENGKLPALVEGVQRLPGPQEVIAALTNGEPPPPAFLASFGRGKRDGAEDFPPSERCLFAATVPLVPQLDGNYLQIIQAADHVVLLTDATLRLIPLDGRPHLPEPLRGWSGDPRGHWEGDTLVVETRNFNNRTRSFAGAGRPLKKVVTERFVRRSAKVLEYQATIVDPATFQDRIVLSLPMGRVDSRIYEEACHEHNYSLTNALSGARAEERAAAAK
jgi:hypothetical protein